MPRVVRAHVSGMVIGGSHRDPVQTGPRESIEHDVGALVDKILDEDVARSGHMPVVVGAAARGR
jgi:hypothetical protein